MKSVASHLNFATRQSAAWTNLSLVRQFMFAGGIVVIAGMLGVGAFVAREIEYNVTQNAASSTALYVDGFLYPLALELESSGKLSVGPITALDEIFRSEPVSSRILNMKIWRSDGMIVYSSAHGMIGKQFEPTEELIDAVNGRISAQFDDLDDDEDSAIRSLNIPVLEIYSPIRVPQTGEIIAVAEFYEDGRQLLKSIQSAQVDSWLAVGGVMLTISALLYGIVHKGSRTIETQRQALESQIREITAASEQNRELRARIQNASQRVAEQNERFLNRTSAELHDGPAQLLSFAALRLGEAMQLKDARKQSEEIALIQQVLDEAMQDIRNVCKGLTIPNIDTLSVQDTIERAANAHVERSKAILDLSLTEQIIPADRSTKIAVFRFVQEALNNAWKHARDSSQTVACTYTPKSRSLVVTVADTGGGFDKASVLLGQGLGLSGLRDRIESIGGDLDIETEPGRGTKLTFKVVLQNPTKQREGA